MGFLSLLILVGCLGPAITSVEAPSGGLYLGTTRVDRIIEARGFKGNDSTGPLLAAIVKEAGTGSTILCPGVNVTGQSKISVMSSLEEKKKEAEELAALAESVGKILKNIVSIPFTVRSEVVSDKTILCVVGTAKSDKSKADLLSPP